MKKYIYILFIGLATLFSCEKELDEVEPEFIQDADNFFNTPTDYERALIGAYDLMQTSYLNIWIGEMASDNSIAGGNSVNDTPGLHQIDNMTHNGVNQELRDVFRFNYAGVTRANYMFENRDNLDFEGKDQIFAQAHFLRAYYYFQLVKYFGDVPLILDRRLSIDEATSIGRTPAAEVYAQIEADLIAAEVLPWIQAEKGRITKGAALSLLGKVYLFQNKFDEAAEVLDRVIQEGIYDLDPDFASIFTVANESTVETVFDIQYSGLEGGGYGCFVCLEGFAAVGFHAPKLYDGPIYEDGNSYNLPTQDLYNAFDPADPRRDASILDIEAFIAARPDEKITYQIEAGGHTGYYNNKYIKREGELGLPDNDLTSPLNHKVIRFADVLLMAAEAHNRKSAPNDALAREYLNRVRSRPSVNMPAITASGASLTQAIWDERRLELSGEGLRFWDLVRTGQAANEIEGFVVGRHELFPLPQAEIDLAGGNWQQNPNY